MVSQTQSRQLATNDFAELTRKLLRRGLRVQFVVQGDSMSPFLRGGETVAVAPLTGVPSEGSIALCAFKNRLLLHRVIQVHAPQGQRGTEVTLGPDAVERADARVRVPLPDVLGVFVPGSILRAHDRFYDRALRWLRRRVILSV